MKHTRLWEIGGFISGAVLILFGAAALYLGINGYQTVGNELSNEFYSVRRNLAGSGGVNTWLRSPTAPLRLGAGSWLNHALCGRYFLKNWRGQADFLACRDRDVPPPLPVLHRPLPIGFVGSDDPELASYLRIEERELEYAGG